MSIEKHIDKMISQAMARGEFDNLEGQGKPLNLADYFATPEDVRVGYSILKSSKLVPEELGRLKEIGDLREQIAACTDETEKAALKKPSANAKSLFRLYSNAIRGGNSASHRRGIDKQFANNEQVPVLSPLLYERSSV